MARPKSVISASVFQEVSIDIGSVAAATTLVVTQAVAGLRVGHPVILWTEAALNAGLNIGNAHCSAAGTLSFRVMNATAGAIDPAAMNFSVVQF